MSQQVRRAGIDGTLGDKVWQWCCYARVPAAKAVT
jgi:hypothetical protein